jgi:hypothetical protein
MPLMRRRLGQPEPDVAGIAGLMGPLSLPGAAAMVASKLSPDDMALLHELLGKPIKVGKRLLRLSSGDPEANRGVVHSSTGEMFSTPLDRLIKLYKKFGASTDEAFPEGQVTQSGFKAPEAKIGPKGGMLTPNVPKKRKIEP